mmetsp:Transcript_30025/g.82407  ORF Transcript_30025/g.82407 Transcript_30025/m.82407 type:complete len:87 (+) Transcript_30025:193-453(+)
MRPSGSKAHNSLVTIASPNAINDYKRRLLCSCDRLMDDEVAPGNAGNAGTINRAFRLLRLHPEVVHMLANRSRRFTKHSVKLFRAD